MVLYGRMNKQRKSFLLKVTGRWKWPRDSDGKVRVPIKVPSGLSKKRRAAIAKAVKEYKDKTCIR